MSARATRSSNRDSQSDILGKRKAPYLIDNDDDDDDDDDLDLHPPHKLLHTDAPGAFSPFGPCLPLTATHPRFYRLLSHEEVFKAQVRRLCTGET